MLKKIVYSSRLSRTHWKNPLKKPAGERAATAQATTCSRRSARRRSDHRVPPTRVCSNVSYRWALFHVRETHNSNIHVVTGCRSWTHQIDFSGIQGRIVKLRKLLLHDMECSSVCMNDARPERHWKYKIPVKISNGLMLIAWISA